MPALDRLRGLRVVADPAALDGARWTAAGGDAAPGGTTVTVLRFAPDDAFAIDAAAVKVDDPDAIVEEERGFLGGWGELDAIRSHLEWSLPADHVRPALVQGSVAGVPAKLWLPADDDRVLVVTAAACAEVLAERLGWRR